jgi:hypothetical protein
MNLDPSSKATPCDACIRGKQVAATIPKLREGEKSKEVLELVFVDLCGAFNTQSRSGNYYILDIVDNATTSGYSIPVADKAHAFDSLIEWQLAIENHTGKHVKAYNIDNGELSSPTSAPLEGSRYATPHLRHQHRMARSNTFT